MEQTDGHKLDKNHIFKVVRFTEFSRIVEVEDTYKPPNAFLNFSFLKDFAGKELQRATEDEEMTGIPLQIRSCESEAPAYLRKDGLAR